MLEAAEAELSGEVEVAGEEAMTVMAKTLTEVLSVVLINSNAIRELQREARANRAAGVVDSAARMHINTTTSKKNSDGKVGTPNCFSCSL